MVGGLKVSKKPLRPRFTALNLSFMPEPHDNYEPTEEDIDMVVEEVTGKPVKPADLAAGVASMRRRILQLEQLKARLLDRLQTATAEGESGLNHHLASVNKDLATARERLGFYEMQLDKQN